MLHSVYDQPDAASVHAQFERLLDSRQRQASRGRRSPRSSTRGPARVHDIPQGHLDSRIWSNNPAERLNKEIRRRTDAVGIFPHREAIRLVGAVLAEQTDEWAESRRYLGLEVLARCRLNSVPDAGTEEVPEPLTITA